MTQPLDWDFIFKPDIGVDDQQSEPVTSEINWDDMFSMSEPESQPSTSPGIDWDNMFGAEPESEGITTSIGKGLAHGALGLVESGGIAAEWAGNRVGPWSR